MAAGMFARARRQRAAQPKPAELDPWSVPEPWRQLLQQALNAQSRFDQAIQDWSPGPIRERLTGLQPRLWADVEDIGTIARRGAGLSAWVSVHPGHGAALGGPAGRAAAPDGGREAEAGREVGQAATPRWLAPRRPSRPRSGPYTTPPKPSPSFSTASGSWSPAWTRR